MAALLISMTAGAVALMALGNNPPSAGPFCLVNYYRLEPVTGVIASRAVQRPERWDSIEVYYSGTAAGNVDQLAALAGLHSTDEVNFHFCICNGLGGKDGQIQATERWNRQWSIAPGRTRRASERTIRICVIADGRNRRPTNCQLRRLQALVEILSRTFEIRPEAIYYPGDWN